jgi:DNA-binding MarR family transcriptional regulator
MVCPLDRTSALTSQPAVKKPRSRAGLTLKGAHDPFATVDIGVTIVSKYVNMADINVTALKQRQPAQNPGAEPVWDLIELLFFAYRDFVGDADEVLAKFGFGRAHHRVLHFVNRNPGMKVAELLDLLRITKQSLGRVLKELVDQGYVVQKEGEQDRRQRLLHVTEKGRALALELAGLQTARIAAALSELGPGARESARGFLAAMIDAEERAGVLEFIERANQASRRT